MIVYQTFAPVPRPIRSSPGLRGLTLDGTGLFGTGLLAGDPFQWDWADWLVIAIGAYAVYAMFFQAKQTVYRAEMAAGRRRRSRATKLRAKAKRLEESEGILGGLL
jgi:hypothetical protein